MEKHKIVASKKDPHETSLFHAMHAGYVMFCDVPSFSGFEAGKWYELILTPTKGN